MKVLIVDDDYEVVEFIKSLLLINKYEVISTTQSIDAVNIVRYSNPNLVILDLMMPGKNGFEVCQEIRSFSKVPILFLSAVQTPGVITKILNEGADDFVEKPMNPNILLASITNLIRRTPQRHYQP
jgi:DNA-binding response OmpR family regulator